MKRFTQLLPMFALALLVAFTFVSPASAQDQGQDQDTPRAERGDREDRADRGDRGDRRARPDWNNMTDEQREQMRARFAERFEEMRKQQAERMREDLELSEDEYAAIQPMIDNVQQLSLESVVIGRGGGRGGPGGPGGPGGFGGRGGFNPSDMGVEMTPQGQALNDAATALRETLDNDSASSDDIKSKLAAVRAARVAMQDTLRQAREELRGFVTPKQEATLVLQGILD